jgi:pyridoxine kinase
MPRVLSIQSHVVHGYVGQKAATFPLQLLGWDVDTIHTVHFANHTGYRYIAGEALTGDQLRRLVEEGLQPNGLLKGITHLLTGYIRSRQVLEAVRELIDRLKQENLSDTSLWYLCDPVLGDHGRLYVPVEMVEAYRDILIPNARLITPNAFELRQLAYPETDIERACDWLHEHRGVHSIVVTGVEDSDRDAPCIYLSEAYGNLKKWFRLPSRIPGTFTGTGDLSAALLLGWSVRTPCLQKAVEYAFSTVYHVLQRTSELGQTIQQGVPPELALIQSAADILEPKLVVEVVEHLDARPNQDSVTAKAEDE